MGEIIDILLLIVLCIWYNRHINWIRSNYGTKPVVYFIVAIVVLCGFSIVGGEYIEDKMMIQYSFDGLLLIVAMVAELFRYNKEKNK